MTGSNHCFVRAAALSVASVLLLSSCSGGDDETAAAPSDASSSSATEDDTGTSSAGASATEEPYLPVPAGVALTDQGSLLALGDTATVAYQPRQETVGVLDLAVTGLQETTFEESFQGWDLEAEEKRATPYFVRATVRNTGKADLGGQTVPLYLLDDQQTLVEPSTFEGDFEPCPSTPLPERFRAKDQAKVCLVFLAPPGRTLEGVTFRPDQDFEAITWTGNVASPAGKSPGKAPEKSGTPSPKPSSTKSPGGNG